MKLYPLNYKRKMLRFAHRKISAQKNIHFLKQKVQKLESQKKKLPFLQRLIKEQDLLRYLTRKEIR